MPRFSIVINTYNREMTLENTLLSLRYLRHPEYEVIVVNGPSTDATPEILDRYSQWIRVGNCDETNISKSRNVGIDMARGDYIAFIDDDAVPELNWLESLEQHYLVNPRLGAVGGFVRNHTGVEYQCKYIVCDRNGDAKFFDKASEAHLDQQPGQAAYYSLIGVNSSFRREALLEVGGFDEEYAYFLDETDVCVRLADAGWLIRHVPDAEVYHNYAPSHLRDEQKVPKSLFYIARSKTYFAFRNALPATPVPALLAQAEDVRRQIHHQANHFFSEGKISPEQHASLLEDGERGFREGIQDGFAYPHGRMLKPQNESDCYFKRMQPVREAGERLRLILISQDYPPRACGGVGVFMHNLATGLAAEGHEISVITRSEGAHTVDFEDGVWVHRIPELVHHGRQHPPLPDLPEQIKNYAYSVFDEAVRIQAIRGASTTIASIWDLESAACVASKAFDNVVYLVTTYQLCLPTKPEWLANEHYREQHVEKVIRGEKWILENCQQAIASTPGILRDVAEAYEVELPNTPVIPFGLPGPKDLQPPTADERLKVLYVGRLEKRKGAHVLLDAIPDLLERHPTAEFQIVGNDTILVDGQTLKEGFLEKHPELAGNDRIRFFGQVDDVTLERMYAECDIFTAPSVYESFGLIFLEAMRYSKPCVGTTAGGIPDVLDASCGVMVPPDNSEALSVAISRLIDSPQLREEMGDAGRDIFERRFSLSRFVSDIEAQMKSIRKLAA